MAYEVELHVRSIQKDDLIHDQLGKGHTNACEAAHHVLILFCPKSMHMHRLHYQVSTNLGLLQSNQSFMGSLEGLSYHWYLELLKHAGMPIYDGTEPTLKHMIVARKERLERAKSEEGKKKIRQWKHAHRRVEQGRRKEWGKRQRVQHKYGEDHDSSNMLHLSSKPELTPSRVIQGRARQSCNGKGSCKCGSTSHRHTTHRDCPLNSHNSRKKVLFSAEPQPESDGNNSNAQSDSDVESDASLCMLGVESDIALSSDDNSDYLHAELCDCIGCAHKRTCPFNPGRSMLLMSRVELTDKTNASELQRPCPKKKRFSMNMETMYVSTVAFWANFIFPAVL